MQRSVGCPPTWQQHASPPSRARRSPVGTSALGPFGAMADEEEKKEEDKELKELIARDAFGLRTYRCNAP